ncbi:MAG: aldehyde dehydrogenase family protein [Candidatus Nitrosocaldaceae archaeon]
MFENELTFMRAVMMKEEEIFHNKYESAISTIDKELGKNHPIIINGREIITDDIFPDISPIDTRIIVGYASRANEEHITSAIKSAKNAYREWKRIDYKERIRIMLKAADIMSKQKYELAALITYENGKNRYEAIADVDEAIDFLRYYADEMEDNNGYIKKMNSCYADEENYSVMRPYGTFAVISPFNFPIAITTGMCTGALITGNTVVLKPSSDTPISAIKIVRIFMEAGVIDGAINLVTGSGKDVGNLLVTSREIDGIVFTGSRDVGLSIFKTNAESPKPIITEMGGKNACIVSKDAEIEKAVVAIARAAFGYSGQKCSACSRLIIDKSIKDEFVNKLLSFTTKLKIGNPIERDTFIGPVINYHAYKKYGNVLEKASKDGKVLFGRIVDELKHGYYVAPMIIDGLSKDHEFVKEELFLPVLTIIEYERFDEAIEIANSVDYGLTAGIFTNNKDEIERFFNEHEAGVLYVNRERSATTGAMVGAQPFVGWKYSGISGKGSGSKYYLPLFMREQSRTQCLQ